MFGANVCESPFLAGITGWESSQRNPFTRS
jgi:hypothetical protein